jgi:hypothetical protein
MGFLAAPPSAGPAARDKVFAAAENTAFIKAFRIIALGGVGVLNWERDAGKPDLLHAVLERVRFVYRYRASVVIRRVVADL